MPAEALKKPDEGAMARILARHPYSPEGVILRLAWQEGLSRKELNELTWDQVDLDGGSILLPDRTVPLEPSVADCLREVLHRVVPTFHEPEEVNAAQGEEVEAPAPAVS